MNQKLTVWKTSAVGPSTGVSIQCNECGVILQNMTEPKAEAWPVFCPKCQKTTMATRLIKQEQALNGEVLLACEIRSQDGTYGVGDLVTRCGSDIHRVVSLTPDGFSGEFECVQEPETGWIKVGEVEHNLARRYRFVRTPAAGLSEAENEMSTKGFAKRMADNQATEDEDRAAWALGDYVRQDCPNCGRHRLCSCPNGKHRCEKCNWCPEDGAYAPVEW